MVRSIIIFVALVGLILNISGCATPRQWVPLIEQAGSCPSDKACIYVIRPAALGSVIRFFVKDNDNSIGTTGPRSYLAWQRDPGEVNIVSKAEDEARIGFTAQAGHTYYILQSVKWGVITVRNNLDFITEAQAVEYLKICRSATEQKFNNQ